MLRMHSIGEDHHLIGCRFGHQGLIHGDKRRLFDFIGLCRQQSWLFILKPQAAHQSGGSRGTVALPVFRRNIRTDPVYVPCRVFGKMGFQSPFVRNTQVSLPLAVMLQAEKRQPRTGKGKLPLRQNRRSDIQNPANRSGVFFCIQQQKRTGALPDKCFNLAAAAKGLKDQALVGREQNRFVGLVHALKVHAVIRMTMRQIESASLQNFQVNSGGGVYQNAPGDINLYLIIIARLGGYLDRKSDPPPGTTVMWRGFSRLSDLEEGFRIGKSKAEQLVGN